MKQYSQSARPRHSAGHRKPPLSWLVISIAVATFALAACSGPPVSPARGKYNDALASLASDDPDTAIASLMEARSDAGADGELRFRSAYNLGIAHAKKADGEAVADPNKAIETYRASAGWFQDALRLRETDDASRRNLEIVLQRIQALGDQLNKDGKKLEARLDRAIEDQRGLRDNIRELLGALTSEGAARDPMGFQSEHDALAVAERTLLAEVGTISDLAGDELSGIESTKEEERSDEQRMRLVQLQLLDRYLETARGSISDARRMLRRLRTEDGLRRADSALDSLKRAKEQLMDPIAVLKLAASEQASTLMHTTALARANAKQVSLGVNGAQEPAPVVPAWLTPGHLTDRQLEVRSRVDEIHQRFAMAVAHQEQTTATATPGDPNAPNAASAATDPAQARLLENARVATPSLTEALVAIDEATQDLADNQIGAAAQAEERALVALLRAIEQFAEVRQLIELAYATQARAIALLDPQAEQSTPPPADPGKELAKGLTDNLDRLARLEGMFKDAVAQAQAQQAQAQQQQQQAGQQGQPGGGEADAAAAEIERYRLAEEHRAKALAALQAMGGKPADVLAAARTGEAELGELRRLFFSVIEHLKDLHRQQSETHDKSANAAIAPAVKLAPLIGPLVDEQGGETELATAIAQALASQADQAAGASDPQAADQAKRFGEAAQEVMAAESQMRNAHQGLAEGAEAAKLMSYDLAPTLASQQSAIEHLERAIAILEPPNENKQDQKDEQEQQEQQDQQQQDQQQQEDVSKQEAERRLQAVRDREAERREDKQQRARSTREPVAKDW